MTTIGSLLATAAPTGVAGALGCLLAGVGCLAALTGCATPGDPVPGPSRISGRVAADRLPPDARIEVYRDEGPGPALPLAGVTSRLDELGRFATPAVLPGRYLVVLRMREGPPSTTEAVVPTRADVDLRIASPGAGTTVVVESPAGAPYVRTLRLSPDTPVRGVPDQREVVLAPGVQARLAGLAPGLWHVDLMPDGATVDFVVPPGESVPRFVIDPPASPAVGGALEGLVRDASGAPAFGAAVTARACSGDGMNVSPWGRVATVDREGRYRIERLEPGTVYVRVERREASYIRVGVPELIRISPSGPARRDFAIRP